MTIETTHAGRVYTIVIDNEYLTIARDGIYAGSGTLGEGGLIECDAPLGEKVYDALEDAIAERQVAAAQRTSDCSECDRELTEAPGARLGLELEAPARAREVDKPSELAGAVRAAKAAYEALNRCGNAVVYTADRAAAQARIDAAKKAEADYWRDR